MCVTNWASRSSHRVFCWAKRSQPVCWVFVNACWWSLKKVLMSSSQRLCCPPIRRVVGRLSWISGSHAAASLDHLSHGWAASRCAHRHLNFQNVVIQSSAFTSADLVSARRVARLTKSGHGSNNSCSVNVTVSSRADRCDVLLLTSSAEWTLGAVWLVCRICRRGVPRMSLSMRLCVLMSAVCKSFVRVHDAQP